MRAFKPIASPRFLVWLLIASLAISAVRCGEAEDVEGEDYEEEPEGKEQQAPPPPPPPPAAGPPAYPPAHQPSPLPPPPPPPSSNYGSGPVVPPPPAIVYEQQVVPVYEQQPILQPQPNYSYPVLEQVIAYEPQQAPVYNQVPLPPLPVYEPVQPIYAQPLPPPLPIQPESYVQPAPVPLPLPQPVVNYTTQPIVPPVIVSPPSYNVTPVYRPPVQQNYSKTAVYVPPVPLPVRPYVSQPQVVGNYSQSIKMPLIPYAQLVGMLPIAGLKNYTYIYLRDSPYRLCPKNLYGAINPREVELAFGFAQQQMTNYRNVQIQFLNATGPAAHSWAARHQMFSFLSQTNARMDEEGLLYEIVSQFLANKVCMSKYEKSRYLPSLAKLPINGVNYLAPSCANIHQISPNVNSLKDCVQSKYRTYDGYCNNPYHPYWGKANICHLRLLPPDYADGISDPRESYGGKYPLPNPRVLSNLVHNDVPIEGPYNLMKMQWGQFINHDITNTGLSSYDGLVDCCKNPKVRGCWPIWIPQPDPFYGYHNVTCLSFIRSGVCPTCALGPRQQFNKNTAYLDASHIYGNNAEQAKPLRLFRGGLLKFTVGVNGEILLPLTTGGEQCPGSNVCYTAGDNRVNQHPALTVLHTLLLRSHNIHATNLARRHPNYSDELLFQEARRLVIAEYQMITYAEYLPIVFGPVLSAFYKLIPHYGSSYTYYNPKVDPSTWNEYSTAACRFGHSQIQGTFGLYHHLARVSHNDRSLPSFRLRDWFNRPSQLAEGLSSQILYGLLDRSAYAVDQWITDDVRNYLYKSPRERTGGDLAATNIWRGREHGIPGYVNYLEYCFNVKVRTWRDLTQFIPYYTLNTLRRLYRSVENIDLFTGGMSENHFPGADIGPTFACINGIQYYHLKFGDRYFFEHQNQAGSFAPIQLAEIKRTTLARLLCRTGHLQAVPVNAFMQPSPVNPIINCTQVGEIDYGKF